VRRQGSRRACHAIDLDISDHFPVVVDFDLGKLPAE